MSDAYDTSIERLRKFKHDKQIALSARAAKLVIFKVQALPYITNLQENLSNEYTPSTITLLQETESVITRLESCEQKIIKWKYEGFDTSPLENLQDRSLPTIFEIFGKYEQNIFRLQIVKNRIQTIESSDPEFAKDPDAHARITAMKQAFRAIDNPEVIESGLRAIETELEEFRKTRKQNEELAILRIAITRAQDIVANEKNPEIQTLYAAGDYEGVIRMHEEQLHIAEKVNKLRLIVKQLNVNAEKIGAVPDSIKKNFLAQDIGTLEKTIKDLDSFIANAKPELTLSLDRTQLSAERWHILGITLTNTGLAHVENVTFAFSSEFETKGIKPISVKAGQSSRTEIRILPKNAGNILLDVTLTYKDLKGMEYRKEQEIPVDVIEKDMTPSPSSDTPTSPVSQFTPKPLTPKQLPQDLSDRYTESEFIGKGGFARVFKAKRKDGIFVALKIPISLDESTGKSFIAELQNWTRLNHPNIVKVYNFNIMPSPYFEMELCDSSLAEREKPIESEDAAWILFNVCEGLKFTHAQKIIHRDLKPHNILLKNGVPKISDWGLSRVITESTSTTAASFTPYYAAPEQISNNQKDERSDIWQLGVIFYELVTGKLPFTGDSMIAVMTVIASKNPTRPSDITPSSQDVEAMIMKCLKKNPDRRYQSVLELQKDLALYLRITYTESLKMSVTTNDQRRSAHYCGDLVMINLLTGDIPTAYKYLLDLVHYSKGDVKVEARELSEQIKMRMEMGVTEIPDELIQKAEIIVHQVSVGFRNRG